MCVLPQTSSSQQQPNKRPPPPPLSLFLDSKKGPHRNNETSNPFCGLLCIWLGWESRKTHTHNAKKKTSVRFPKSSGFFSHASPQKLIFVLTKRRRRKRYLERKNTTTTTTTTTTPGAPSSLRKRRIQVRGRGSDDRGSFFDAPPDAMIGDHDGYKWRKYGQKNIKSASYPRSYYRCTRPDCPARKQVENGVAKYENEHNHEKPSLLLHSQKTDLHRAKSGKVEKKKSKGAMMMMSHALHVVNFFFFRRFSFLGVDCLSIDRNEQENCTSSFD